MVFPTSSKHWLGPGIMANTLISWGEDKHRDDVSRYKQFTWVIWANQPGFEDQEPVEFDPHEFSSGFMINQLYNFKQINDPLGLHFWEMKGEDTSRTSSMKMVVKIKFENICKVFIPSMQETLDQWLVWL